MWWLRRISSDGFHAKRKRLILRSAPSVSLSTSCRRRSRRAACLLRFWEEMFTLNQDGDLVQLEAQNLLPCLAEPAEETYCQNQDRQQCRRQLQQRAAFFCRLGGAVFRRHFARAVFGRICICRCGIGHHNVCFKIVCCNAV